MEISSCNVCLCGIHYLRASQCDRAKIGAVRGPGHARGQTDLPASRFPRRAFDGDFCHRACASSRRENHRPAEGHSPQRGRVAPVCGSVARTAPAAHSPDARVHPALPQERQERLGLSVPSALLPFNQCAHRNEHPPFVQRREPVARVKRARVLILRIGHDHHRPHLRAVADTPA